MKKWLCFAVGFALLALSGTGPSVAQDDATSSISIPGLSNLEITESHRPTWYFHKMAFKSVFYNVTFNGPAGSGGNSNNDKNLVFVDFIIDKDGQAGLSQANWESACRILFSDCSRSDRGEVPNQWRISRGHYGNLTCQQHLALAMSVARRWGYQVMGPGLMNCSGGEAIGQLNLAPRGTVVAGQCSANSYAGAWSRPGMGEQRAQVRLQFDDPAATKQPMGRVSGFNASPYREGEVVVSQIEPPQNCAYRAQCSSPSSSANPCTLNIDPAKGTLKIAGGSKVFISDVIWTRSAPAPQEKTCSAADIEGNWTRSDGAQISVAGVKFKDGGNALLYNHPTGGWPKGAFKFSQIKSTGSCNWAAQCATVYRDSAKGGFNTVSGACTLTVDPETKTMTASGTHGSFKR